MTEAVCFIDWATKCKHGDKYVNDYDFGKECKTNEGDWIEQEITRLDDILDKTEFHLQRSQLTPIQRKRYLRRRDNTRTFLTRSQDMQSECSAKRTGGLSAQGLGDDIYVRGDRGDDEEEDYDDEDYDEDYDYSASHSRD